MSNMDWNALAPEVKIAHVKEWCTEFFLLANVSCKSVGEHSRAGILRTRINNLAPAIDLEDEQLFLGFSKRAWAMYPTEWKAKRLLEVTEAYCSWCELLRQYDTMKPAPLVPKSHIQVQIDKYLDAFEHVRAEGIRI